MLYRQALTLAPRDAQVWLKHGETLRQLGQDKDAIDSYRMAATILATDGHYGRAVAAMKLALEMRPDDVDIVSDIIRLEVRHAQVRERPLFASTGSGVVSSPSAVTTATAVFANTPTPVPQLALPMITSVSREEARSLAPVAPVPAVPMPLEVDVAPTAPQSPPFPQVRRLSDSEVAMKATADGRWVVVSSVTPLMVRFAEQLEAQDAALLE